MDMTQDWSVAEWQLDPPFAEAVRHVHSPLTGNVGSWRAGGSGPRPGARRGLRAGGPGSGGGWILAQERGDVVGADAEGAELADVVADLAVAVDLGVVEVGAEVVVPG